MKKLCAIFTIVVCAYGCVARNADTTTSDATILAEEETEMDSILPPRVLEILNDCDSIKWLLLDPMCTDTIEQPYAVVGEVLSEILDINENRIGAVKSTLSYSKSFVKTDMKKDCTFLPDVAFIAYANNQKLYFAYSFYCDLCRFETDSVKEELDGELIRDAILQLSLEVFPNDRYIRRIAGKTR